MKCIYIDPPYNTGNENWGHNNKGKHLFDGVDAEDKRAVGEIWASRSDGRCLFVMPTDGDFSMIRKLLGA